MQKETFRLFMAFSFITFFYGHAVTQLLEALYYKPEGRGFDSQ
jgi:hypothetical protein